MARWQDGFSVRQPVHILVCGEWHEGWVRRKTATGMPVVLTTSGGHFAIDRKGDIRPAQAKQEQDERR